ncbi:MAG: hypothetical protein Q6L68_00655 [Thermostichus sp. DG02_5_bins_236]
MIYLLIGLLLVGLAAALLLLPQRVTLRYRKPWDGPLVWIGQWHLPGRLVLQVSHRGWQCRWGSLCWRGRWPKSKRWSLTWADLPRYGPALFHLGRQFHLKAWQGGLEIGFADPALTGPGIGLIAALPPQLAQHIRLTFMRIGWQGQGSLLIQFRGWRMLGPGLKLGWQLWQASHQPRKRL